MYDGELFLDEPDDALPARVEPPAFPELPEAGEPEYPRPRLVPLLRGALLDGARLPPEGVLLTLGADDRFMVAGLCRRDEVVGA